MQPYDQVKEVEEGVAQPAQNVRWRRSTVGLVLVAAAVGLALVVMRTNGIGGPPTVDPDETIIKVEDHEWNSAKEGSDFDLCKNGGNDWDSVTSLDPSAQEASKKAFQLLVAARQKCSDVKGFPFGAEAFGDGGGHKHYLHVHRKFASDCKSETYKLHFFIGSDTKDDGKDSSFVVQVSRDRGSNAWQLLQSSPNPCNIQVGSAAAPQVISVKTNIVKKASMFALSELTYQLEQNGCLPAGADTSARRKLSGASLDPKPNADGFSIESVENAVVTVMAGVEIRMKLRFRNPKKVARVIVFERCAGATECIRQLRMPGGKGVCEALESATEEDRRLDDRRMGAEPDDPTEIMVAQRQAFFEPGRRLATDRAPLIGRHITEGHVPAEHDPRATPCFTNIAVYDQGSCASCYANAIGQMMGIRKCMSDSGRRLIEEVDSSEERRLASGRITTKNCKCKQTWTYGNYPKCTEGCCNPDNHVGDWCPVEDRQCQGAWWGNCKPKQTPQPKCEDSATWKLYAKYGCAWFASNDAGCTHYKDYGQRTHCKKTCNTCPVVLNQNTNANPWHSALYKYMPSVNDLAQCANSGGQMQGCDGGNTQGVWNNWMRTLNRKVWVMGESCKPYTMKCKSSSGVVNPLTGGSCSKYSNYQKWHKPCSCIGNSVRPKSFQCPNTRPSSSCGFDVPPAFFTVSGMIHGLTNAEAVLNMQRHIAEFGPIYVSFKTTSGFMGNDWNRNPVYTGGGAAEGGHAVISVGWGTRNRVDYWLLRNSWGGDYASGGYMKFRRGVNLDGIEDSAAASMPTSNFKDWSPPVCALKSWSYGYSTRGGQLSSYTLTMKVQCNKACSLNIFTSERLTNRDQIKSGVSGTRIQAKITSGEANQMVAMKKVEMKSLRFGAQKGNMWVQIKADDGKGNKASSDSFVNIPQAPW